MSSVAERTKAREEELKRALSDQRRLAIVADYVYDKAQEQYWDLRDGTLHTEKSVDASIPIESWRVEIVPAATPKGRDKEKLIQPSKDIMRVENDRFVEAATWWPGQPQIIKDWFVDNNGFYPAHGRRIYNQYKEPPVFKGKTPKPDPWIEHVKRLWPDPVEHRFFFDYCAHMVQRPHEKCNVAIVMSGTQGIGKDAALSPIKSAVGQWNHKGIDPDEVFSQFRPWLQTLMLVIDETRPSRDEMHASSFYNILKPMIAAPPDTLPVNDKHAKLRYIINVLRVFMTTNNWLTMFIPKDDRRLFIMHSTLEKDWHLSIDPEYFVKLFGWMQYEKGNEAIAKWLAARDISDFKPKAPAIKTPAWHAISQTWGEPEDAISGVIEKLNNPQVILSSELVANSFDGVDEIKTLMKSPRKLAHRLQQHGYVMVKCPAENGVWDWRDPSGARVRCRSVFAQQSLLNDRTKTLALVMARGAELLRAKVDGGSIESRF